MESSPINPLDDRFRRTYEHSLHLSESDAPRPFQLCYADFGYQKEPSSDDDGEEEYVLLYFGPLLASRSVFISKDELAKRHKIRVISIDRPGMGGTDSVKSEDLLAVFRDVVAGLLRHLSISHVSTTCQSAGTVYMLDFLAHYPEFLHPERPYISFGGPWIDISHRSLGVVSAISYLPRAVIAQTDVLVRGLNNYIGPMMDMLESPIQLSLAITNSFSNGSAAAAASAIDPGANASTEEEKELWRRMVKSEEILWETLASHITKEGVKGMSADAVLLTRKGEGMAENGWSDWGDYDKLIPKVADVFRSRGSKLKVDVFFAEKDAMIGDSGTKGPLWFASLWKQEPMDWVDYYDESVKGANHDNVFFLRYGAIRKVFEAIRREER